MVTLTLFGTQIKYVGWAYTCNLGIIDTLAIRS
jgi:hypothetical protein